MRTLKIITMLFTLLVTGMPAGNNVHAQVVPKKRILIINSYHQGLSWTDNIVKGIESVLRSGEDVTSFELYFEYMDTKRFYGERYFQRLYDEYAEKFSKEHFDVLIVADNDAFNFVRRYHRTLFPSTPIVFCGINNYKDRMVAGLRSFTGVVEATDVKSTIDIALKLHPRAKQIVVVSDMTTTGIAMKNEVLEVFPYFSDRVKFIFLEDFDMAELQSKVRSVPLDSIILLTVVNRDRTGNFFAYEESIRLIYPATKVPIYSIWDFYLGKGITGGMLTSGFQQGKSAAEIAVRLLKGEKVSAIPVIKKSPNLYMFDYNELERFRVDLSKLPPESTVINKPDTFYIRHRNIILIIFAVIFILTIIIFSLLIYISMRKQYAQAIEESEKKYRDLYDNAPDMYHSIDHQGIIIDCNETEARMLGYPKKDIIGRSTADFMTPRSREAYLKEFPKLLEKQSLFGIEREYMRKDGSTFPASLNVFVEVDDNGKMIRTKTIARDMTESNRVEIELRRSREELRNLSAHIQSAREEERSSIAREIHDALGQTLSRLKLDIAWLKKRFPKDLRALTEKADAMSKLVDSTISDVQRISSELRPSMLDDLGLPAAIEWQANEFRDQTGIRFKMDIFPDIVIEDTNVAIVVFRIFQEALTNIMRHSRATRVSVSLKLEGDFVVLEVKDNGIGILEGDISSHTSFGIMGMRERARHLKGTVSIIGVPGKNTTVSAKIPLNCRVEL